jgi:hypothetical protein
MLDGQIGSVLPPTCRKDAPKHFRDREGNERFKLAKIILKARKQGLPIVEVLEAKGSKTDTELISYIYSSHMDYGGHRH